MFNIYPVRSTMSSQPSRARRAVIVDRDPDHCSMLLRHMVEAGFVVVIAHGWFEALSLIGRDGPAVALFQRDGDDGDCDRAVALARILYPQTHVIQTESADRMPVANDPARPQDGGLSSAGLILVRPVSLPSLDRALRELSLLREVV